VHVAPLISDAIYQFAGFAPMRHPVDPEKSNMALAFPAQEEDQQPAADVPPPPQEEVQSLRSISDCLDGIELQMHRYKRHVTSQQAANHRGQRQLNETFYCYNMHQQSQDPSPFPWPIPEQFEATVAWLRDEIDFEMQAGPAGTSGGGDEAQDNQNMADMLDFLL